MTELEQFLELMKFYTMTCEKDLSSITHIAVDADGSMYGYTSKPWYDNSKTWYDNSKAWYDDSRELDLMYDNYKYIANLTVPIGFDPKDLMVEL